MVGLNATSYYAQMQEGAVPTELFGGSKSLVIESFWFKNIPNSKWDYFSYLNAEHNYKTAALNSSYIQGLFTYNFTKKVGASLGYNFYNNRLNPTVALSVQGEGKGYYWNIFPSWELIAERNFDIWGIYIHYPTIKRIPLFTQVITEMNFNSKQLNTFALNVRAGYNYKNKIQIGAGNNFLHNFTANKFFFNSGIFIRHEF